MSNNKKLCAKPVSHPRSLSLWGQSPKGQACEVSEDWARSYHPVLQFIAKLTLVFFIFQDQAASASVILSELSTGSAISAHGTTKGTPGEILASLALPEELGIIREVYVAEVGSKKYEVGKNNHQNHTSYLIPPTSTNKLIVHIQDAHAQTDAQRKIESILKHLHDQYGIKTFFLEGAPEGRLSNELLRFTKDDKVNQEIAEKLLEKALVTGPGLFLLKESRGEPPKASLASGGVTSPLRAFGLEDKRLYFEHLKSFEDVYRQKDKADAFLHSLKLQLEGRNSKLNNLALKKFLKRWFFFQEDKRSLITHLKTLDFFAWEHLKLDFYDAKNQLDYPMLVRMFKLKDLEKERIADSVERIEKDKEKLHKWLISHQLNSYLNLFDLFLSAKRSTLNPRHFLERF